MGWPAGCGLAIGAVLWPFAAAAVEPDASWREAPLYTVVTLKLPPGAELREDAVRYPDFLIYRVFSSGAEVLGIYVGNAAGFPNRGAAKAATVGPCSGGLDAASNDGGGASRDALLQIRTQYGFPRDVHFFYRRLGATAAELSDAIIANVALTDTAQCSGERR